MSKTGTTRVTVKPGETLPRGDTDWGRLDAMTDEEIMAAALSDPTPSRSLRNNCPRCAGCRA